MAGERIAGEDRSLALIEVGRAIAAIVVVVHHAASASRALGDPVSWKMLQWGDRGVDFFFVLSGFIIYYAHHADFGVPGRADRYARKRLIRLFPSLWVIAGGWILLSILFRDAPSFNVAASTLLLYPSNLTPLPVVVWSLRHEILFYLLFWAAIRAPRAGVGLAALWLAASAAQLLFEPFRHNAGAMILSAFNFQFAAGVLAGWAFTRIRLTRACWPLMAGSIVLVVAILAFMQMHDIKKYDALDYISPARTWWVIALALPLAALTWALASGSATVRVPGWARYLGAASYSIYLIHLPAMSLAKPFIIRLIPVHLLTSPIAVVPFAIAGVIAGVVFHGLVEKPLLRVLRLRFLASNASITRGNFSTAAIGASEQPDAQAMIIANEGTASVAAPSTE